jgi:uncharacterized membrane protein
MNRANEADSLMRNIARFLNLLLTGLLAGLLVGIVFVELSFLGLSAFVYTAVEQPKHRVFEPIMPVFNTLVIGSGILVLLLTRERKTLPFALTLAGVLCTIVMVISTLLVNVPINSEIMNVWSVENPPADWAQVRDRWNFWHAFRTVLAVVAFVCQLVAVLVPIPMEVRAKGRGM